MFDSPNQPPSVGGKPTLPPRPGRGSTSRRSVIGLGVLGLVAGGAGGFAAGRSTAPSSGGGTGPKLTTVTIGVTDADHSYWTSFKSLAKEHGIDLKTVNFSDYTQANPALAQGQLDLNLFQHLVFLANYNVANHQSLTPIGSTYVVPLGLYSKKHQRLSQIPAGGTIAIPNDPTNQGRALLVLQAAGLVKLTGGGSILSTPANLDKGASKVTVTPVDAAQTVTALPSVDGAIVNNNFALDGNLDPSKALYADDPRSAQAEPYINVIVARAQDKDNPTYAEVVRLYQDPSVQKLVAQESKGTSVAIRRSPADLRSILARLEKTVAGS